MQSTNIPSKIPLPFGYAAGSSYINPIPAASQIGINDGRASLHDGFPPDTFTPVAAGGIPPFGGDFNGILNEITSITQWQEAGGFFVYDAAFSTAVGGYPKGAILQSTSFDGLWTSSVENNTSNPDANGAGWTPTAFNNLKSIALSGSSVTLTQVQAAYPILIFTGTLTANCIVNIPAQVGKWIVVNRTTGSFTVQFKTPLGTGINAPQGYAVYTYGDATNIYYVSQFIDANNVYYNEQGINAVTRTAQSKLQESVSVKDFGAIGDGITDDTAAINNALAASNAVYFPSGTYLTSGNINIESKSLYGVPTNSTSVNAVSIIKLSGSNTNSSLFINGGSITTAWGSGGGCLLRDLHLQGNWDGSTSNAITDISSIGALVKWWSGAYIKIQNCLINNSFGFGVFSYQLGYSVIEDSFISANAKNGIHLEAPSGNSAITSTTIDNCSINSCRGAAPTGGNGIYIKNGFYCDVNGCVIEDVLCGIYLDGADNRSITVFETHMESTTNAGIYYIGSGQKLLLLQNIFATAPFFIQTNPQFQTYTAIGNYGVPDVYNLPVIQAPSTTQVYLNAATPQTTLNQLTLTPGTWIVNASWMGVASSGTGQVSARQQFALNTSASFPSFATYFQTGFLQGDCSSTVNTWDGALNSTITITINVISNTTIYLYGGPKSITGSLSVACVSYIQATQINGAYIGMS